MDLNDNYSNQFNRFLPDQHNQQQQTHHCPLHNFNITTSNNGQTSDVLACDQQFLQPVAPMNNISMSPTFRNNYPNLMPPEPLPLPNYIDTNNINSHLSLQDVTNYSCASGVNPLETNWEAINAFLAGHVLPGADVTRVYRCVVCNVEFVNPQALGGHMSSHNTGRKNKKLLRSTKPTKFKRNSSKKLKKTKNF